MRTSDYVGHTCSTVEDKVTSINFQGYLDELQKAVFNPDEALTIFTRIAQEAGVVAQKWGASVVRDGFREAVLDLEYTIDGQLDTIAELEARIQELEDE